MKKEKHIKKVAIAISGGVDSSVSAQLLLKQGFDVFGVFMRLGIEQEQAEESARLVCKKLGIKFYPINISEKFKDNVVSYFLESYQSGITPNPCVHCNKTIKFGELFQRARGLGADFLATGHYIKKVEYQNRENELLYRVFRGKDSNKDQSYFLYNLNQDLLKHLIFPLADYVKTDVKKIAQNANLPNLKSESQDICFLPGEHNDYLKEHLKLKPGPIKTIENNPKVVGEHQGLPLYTIGQRRGIEIGGTGPYYVSKMDYKNNTLYVVNDVNNTTLFSNSLIVKNVNWISNIKPKLPVKYEAVIRYRHKTVQCTIVPLKDASGSYFVKFNQPQRAVTPGQSIVFYNKDELLGGGIISSTT